MAKMLTHSKCVINLIGRRYETRYAVILNNCDVDDDDDAPFLQRISKCLLHD